MVDGRIEGDSHKGMALALAVILLLALTALAHGTLVLARQELRTSWAFRHARRAGEASEGALRLAIREPGPFRADRPSGERRLVVRGRTEDGLGYEAFLLWLGPEFFLLEGRGTSRGWDGSRRSTWVGWSLSPGARLAALGAIVEVGGAAILAAGSVEADELISPPAGWDEADCAGYQALMDSVLAQGHPLPLGPLEDVSDPGNGDEGEGPGLGLLTPGELLDRAGADSRLGGEDGASSSFPAFDSLPDCHGPGGVGFWGVEGSLHLGARRACGLLVVTQDLHLEAGAAFQGLVLVGGSLFLGEGAVLEGMARVGENLTVDAGGHLVGSFCPFLAALSGIDVLRDPVIPPNGYRLNGY